MSDLDGQVDDATCQGMLFLLHMRDNFVKSVEGKVHLFAPLSLKVDEFLYPSPYKS